MKKFLLLIYLFPLNSYLNAQDLKIGFQYGLGSYKMTDLKNINNAILEKTSIINTKMISNYPQYLYYQPTIVFSYKKFSIGLLYNLQSSGSRISVKDYSGEYRFDSKIKSNGYGFIAGYNLTEIKKFKLTMYTEYGDFSSKLNLIEFFTVNNSVQTNSNFNFTSKNSYIEPGLIISYQISFVNVEFNLGYFYQTDHEAFRDNSDELLIFSGSSIEPNWSGLRTGLSAYIVIPFTSKTKLLKNNY